MKGLTGVATGLAAKFNEIVSVAAKFVVAFDPAIVAELNRAFRDLDAVIGTALRPIIVSAIDIIRGFGGAIYSAMQQLAPVIQKITSSIASALQPAFNALGQTLQYLMPVFDGVADVVAGLIDVFGDVLRGVQAFGGMLAELGKQLFGSLFGTAGDVKDQIKSFMQSIRDAVQGFVKNLVLAVASFLKLIGATDTLNGLIKGLAPPEVRNIQGAAAPQNAAFAGLGDVGKQLMQAAFTASAAGGKGSKNEKDYLADLVAEAQKIASGEMTNLPKQAADILGAIVAVKDKLQALYDFIAKPIGDALSAHQENANLNARGKASRESGKTPEWKGDQGRHTGGFWDNLWQT